MELGCILKERLDSIKMYDKKTDINHENSMRQSVEEFKENETGSHSSPLQMFKWMPRIILVVDVLCLFHTNVHY